MESPWSSLLVVAAVFTAFSGVASIWGRLQRRQRERQQAVWQALLDADRDAPAVPSVDQPASASLQPTEATTPSRRRSRLPPDPSLADSPSFVSDSDSRRAALDEALDRMSRQPPRRSARASSSASPGAH